MAGPFYFAFVDQAETTFEAGFARHDAYLKSFVVEQAEGDFCSLTIEVEKPTLPLLDPARSQWAWLSWQNGSAVEPLFFGRIIGLPANLQNDFVQLEFLAKPINYDQVKRELAATLRVAPFWDYAFIDPQRYNDPDAVLEARTDLWHIDRATHELSISSIMEGEDGLLEIDPEHIPAGGLQLSYGESPLRRVSLEMRSMWKQYIRNVINVSEQIRDAFGGKIQSYSGEGLYRDWPRRGDSLDGVWRFGQQSIEPIDGRGAAKHFKSVTVKSMPEDVTVPDVTIEDNTFNVTPNNDSFGSLISMFWADQNELLSNLDFGIPELGGGYNISVGTGGPYSVSIPQGWFPEEQTNQGNNPDVVEPFESKTYNFRRWEFAVQSNVVAELELDRTEDITYTVVAGVQDVVTDPDDGFTETLVLSSGLVGSTIRVGSYSELPVGDVGRSEYFAQARGRASIEFGLAKARAILVRRARTAVIEVPVPFAVAVEASCRKSALVTHPDLPGGSAEGKIVAYAFGVDGATGDETGMVRVACLVGTGANLSASGGSPQWVDDDWVEDEYQERVGAVYLGVAGSMTYPDPVAPDSEWARPALVAVTVQNTAAEQEALLGAAFEDINAAADVLNGAATTVSIELSEVDESPQFAVYDGGRVDLAIPMGINLGGV